MGSHPRWLKQSVQSALLAALLVLAGCTVCPPSTDQWSEHIENQPEKIKPKDSRLEEKTAEGEEAPKGPLETFSGLFEEEEDPTEGVWFWQDGGRRWAFTGQQPPEAPGGQWLYEARSLAFRISAGNELNSFKSQPHTLSIKIFQLSDPAIISELRQSPFGLSDLMAQKGNALSGDIVREDRIDIAPGKTKTLLIDREQGARYVAIVAGFFDMDGKKAVRLMKIPAVKPRILPCYDPLPWPIGADMPPTPSNVPGRLKVWLNVESDAITNVEARVF